MTFLLSTVRRASASTSRNYVHQARQLHANHHIEKKKPMPYVNHYSFHILDAEWGHITIKISGHPPFPAQIMLNGHEYVAKQRKGSSRGQRLNMDNLARLLAFGPHAGEDVGI
jgi:hypothetical protein